MRPARVLAGLIVAALATFSARADTSLEYAVKAAYLAKFAPFIDWPDSAFASPTAPLVICVVGNDRFGDVLDKAVSGQKDGDRSLTLKRMAALDPAQPCQILFAADAETLDAVKSRPVVTVTDSGGRGHGMIGFVIIDNHVRFDIDAAAADEVGVKISSKLLGLAHAVRQKGGRP